MGPEPESAGSYRDRSRADLHGGRPSTTGLRASSRQSAGELVGDRLGQPNHRPFDKHILSRDCSIPGSAIYCHSWSTTRVAGEEADGEGPVESRASLREPGWRNPPDVRRHNQATVQGAYNPRRGGSILLHHVPRDRAHYWRCPAWPHSLRARNSDSEHRGWIASFPRHSDSVSHHRTSCRLECQQQVSLHRRSQSALPADRLRDSTMALDLGSRYCNGDP